MDAEKEGKELAKKHAISAYPTFAVLNAQGNTLHRWMGYSKKMFLTRTGEAAADLTTIDEKLARFETDPSAGDAATLGRYYDSRAEYADAIRYFESAEKMNQDPSTSYLRPIFETTFYGHRKDAFSFSQLKTRADALFASNATSDEDLIAVASMMVYAGKNADKPDAVVPFLEKAVVRTASSDDEDVVENRKEIMPDYAMLVLKDPDKALAYKRASMKEGWQESPDGLNSFAWWCFENTINLKEAQAMAEKGVGLAETGAEKAQILDTAAEICNARDDCAGALALIRRAIQADPDNEYYKKQEKRFLELLAQKNGIR